MSEPSSKNDERAPLFGTWRKAYVVVVASFAIDVALFYFFDHYFS